MKVIDHVHFPEHQVVFTGPPDVLPLPARLVPFSDGSTAVVSAWVPNFRERLKILFGRPIYLSVQGTAQPAVSLGVDPEIAGLTQDISSQDALEVARSTRRITPNGNPDY
jgi:hypothetical protein